MPTVDEILERIDLEPVVAAIRAEPLEHWGYEDAAKICWNVASRFLPADLERYWRCAGIEQHWALHDGLDCWGASIGDPDAADAVAANPRHTVHGYADLVMSGPDGLEVIDWKTASELDKSWTDRLSDSWQWRIYCAVYSSKRFAYRGIDKSGLAAKIPGKPYDWGAAPMRELVYTPSGTNTDDVSRYLYGALGMRGQLEWMSGAGDGDVWPRRMPDACRSFGQRCSYWDVCRGGPEPEGAYAPKAFSYSGIAKFLNCPDHYRMSTVTGVRESSPATDLGNAVHRGTAALYAQFNDLKDYFYDYDASAATEATS